MPPSKIMIIRHAEKPEPGAPEKGIAPEGGEDGASLTAEGWKRARKLVGFFSDADAPGIATPDAIFACKPEPDSRRPMETVSLLAAALWDEAQRATRFNAGIARGDVDALATAVKSTQGVCLICWEHHLIPAVAAAFAPLPPPPGKWPGHRFDVVWVLDAHAGQWAFSQTPENLLPDDEDKPIKS